MMIDFLKVLELVFEKENRKTASKPYILAMKHEECEWMNNSKKI